MTLFQKGLLAFAIVILIAVATVAVVAGYRAETAFRRYAFLYSGRTQVVAELLLTYYRQQGGWSGLQNAWTNLVMSGPGRGQQGGMGMGGPTDVTYQVADRHRYIVASSEGNPTGRMSLVEATTALPLKAEGLTVGYLMVTAEERGVRSMALDAPANAFLRRLRWALALGGGVAFLAALLLASLLTRNILSPIQTLSRTAERVAQGQFDVRAEVRGRDEIANLAATFNRMATSLQHAQEARRAQTADIAHELRNPLAVLQSSLEALADGIYEPTPENITPVLDQVRTLNRLVEDLRTLALADAGQLHLDRQPLDIKAMVTRVAQTHREALLAQGIDLTVTLDDELPAVTADYTRLTQVLNNILGNAARYVPAGCTVIIKANTLSSKDRDKRVQICVIDNGPGIPEAMIPRIFDRFWRNEPSRSRSTGGSGLGLTIARQIIKAHDGEIWAEPTPGGGLTLCFWLPAT
jgi:signal transduction histidine kinase